MKNNALSREEKEDFNKTDEFYNEIMYLSCWIAVTLAVLIFIIIEILWFV